MPLGERLRRLDDRVLGPPRPDSPTLMCNPFVLALLGLVVFVGFALVTGGGTYLAGVGGFLGVLLSTGIRWRRAASRSST